MASTYTQRYLTVYENAETPLSGEIGLGTQTGEVGRVYGAGAPEGGGVRAGVGLGVGVVVVGGMGLVL